MWSRGDDGSANQVFWRGWNGYEPETSGLFFDLAARARVTIDVGAHVGYFTLLAAHANPNGRVFAFEPHPAAFERLRRNVALNQLSNVECIQAAVGETDGSADFYFVETSNIPSSSSLSLEFMRAAPNLSRSTVAVQSLDSFVTERALEALDLLKVDTETTEPQVLRGCDGGINRFRPTIICEILRGRASAADLRQLLTSWRYRARLLTSGAAQRDDDLAGHERWLNYIFVPAERDNSSS